MLVTASNSARWVLAQKLASHFQVPKQKLNEEFTTESLSAVVSSSTLRDQRDFNHTFFCAGVNNLDVMMLTDYNKLEKSMIAYFFNLGEGMIPPVLNNRYILALHITGTLWLIRRGVSYEGVGGIVVTSSDRKKGYIMEPIKNFLNRNYPRESAD